MRKVVFMVLCILSAFCASGQDPHFSQFSASPLTLSPAFTGKFDGTIRGAANYRNQWPTINKAFVTTTLSVDFPVLKNSIGYNDIFGVGLMGYSDKSAAGAVTFNYFSMSTAFHKGLDEDGFHQLGIGLQGTYANMMINTSGLKFEDQLTSTGFTGVSSEVFNGSTLKNSYFDISAGLLYTGSTSDRNNFYIGVSGYHLNRPKQQFTGALYSLAPRVTAHGGGSFDIGETMTMHLSAMTSSQAKAGETLIGGVMEFAVGGMSHEAPINVYTGGWVRLSDALIPYVGLEVGDFRLGASYDVNTSKLKTGSQGQGGVELSLVFVRKHPEGKGIKCPKF